MSGIPRKRIATVKGLSVETSSITPLPSSQLLNRYGVQHNPHCLEKVIRNNNDSDYWHRFTISNESGSEYPKKFVLKVITDFVYPCDLLPVHVDQRANKIFFLARNCLQAILKLCKAELTVPNPNNPDSPFTVVIIKGVSTVNQIPVVNVEPNILEVLKKRYKYSTLDLSRFHQDKELQEFCPLAQTKLLLYVLSLSTKLEDYLNNKIFKIILSHNDIRHLPDFDSLSNPGFNTLDLSHNKIQNIEDIVPLKDLPNLLSVQLHDNPLCCRFESGITYFLYVKSICRSLTTLDNKRLFEDDLYKKHRTFICDTKGFDFANQFLEQYFTYYDELNRPNIKSFYSKNAIFSLTYRDMPDGNLVFKEKRPAKGFRLRNRNLIDHMRRAQSQNLLFCGKENVVDQLLALPVVRHNPHSFFVDLMTYSKTQAVIHVTGVFRDQAVMINYGFTRNFILASRDGREWIITNDQLCAYAPFKYGSIEVWPNPKTPSLFPESNFNLSHMNDLTMTFESITGMAYEHSKRFLEKNNWNLELALKVFIDEHINDEIPDEAFNDESEEEQNVISDDEAVIITEDDILPPIESLLINLTKQPVQSVSTATKQSTVLPEPSQQSSSSTTSVSNQYKNQTAVVSAEKQKPVQKQDSSTFWEHMRRKNSSRK